MIWLWCSNGLARVSRRQNLQRPSFLCVRLGAVRVSYLGGRGRGRIGEVGGSHPTFQDLLGHTDSICL